MVFQNDIEQLNVNFTGRRIIARMNVKFNKYKSDTGLEME